MFKSARILPRYIAKLRGLEDSEPRSSGMTKTNNYGVIPTLDMGAAEDWRSADDDDDADNAGQSDADTPAVLFRCRHPHCGQSFKHRRNYPDMPELMLTRGRTRP